MVAICDFISLSWVKTMLEFAGDYTKIMQTFSSPFPEVFSLLAQRCPDSESALLLSVENTSLKSCQTAQNDNGY